MSPDAVTRSFLRQRKLLGNHNEALYEGLVLRYEARRRCSFLGALINAPVSTRPRSRARLADRIIIASSFSPPWRFSSSLRGALLLSFSLLLLLLFHLTSCDDRL